MDHRTRTLVKPRSLPAAAVLVLTLSLGLAACAGPETSVADPVDPTDLSSSSESTAESAADGHIPYNEPVSIFDESLPAIANLDPELRAAVQAAVDSAEADGQEMWITSGWRSAAYQQSLLDDAILEYGSFEEALKWVNTAERSSHVSGHAVDVTPLDAQFWLLEHGYEYGLCQSYTNERWHFELTTEPGGTCAPAKVDATG